MKNTYDSRIMKKKRVIELTQLVVLSIFLGFLWVPQVGAKKVAATKNAKKNVKKPVLVQKKGLVRFVIGHVSSSTSLLGISPIPNNSNVPPVFIKLPSKQRIRLALGTYEACFNIDVCFNFEVKQPSLQIINKDYDQLRSTLQSSPGALQGAIAAQKERLDQYSQVGLPSLSRFIVRIGDKEGTKAFVQAQKTTKTAAVTCEIYRTIQGSMIGSFGVEQCFGEQGLVLSDVPEYIKIEIRSPTPQGTFVYGENLRTSSLPIENGAKIITVSSVGMVKFERADDENPVGDTSRVTPMFSLDEGKTWTATSFEQGQIVPIGNQKIWLKVGNVVYSKTQLFVGLMSYQKIVVNLMDKEDIFITTARTLPKYASALALGSSLPCYVDIDSMLALGRVKLHLGICSSIQETVVRPKIEMTLWQNPSKTGTYYLHGVAAHLQVGVGGGKNDRFNLELLTGIKYTIQVGQNMVLGVAASLLLYMDRVVANDPNKQPADPILPGIRGHLLASAEFKVHKNVKLSFYGGMVIPKRPKDSAEYGNKNPIPLSSRIPGLMVGAQIVFTGFPFTKDDE